MLRLISFLSCDDVNSFEGKKILSRSVKVVETLKFIWCFQSCSENLNYKTKPASQLNDDARFFKRKKAQNEKVLVYFLFNRLSIEWEIIS